MQRKCNHDSLSAIHQRWRRACMWTDDARAHVVWSLVVASLSKKIKEVAKGEGKSLAIASSSTDALCALVRVCSTTRTAVLDAAIFADALFATDNIHDITWSHGDKRAVEISTRFAGDNTEYTIDYSARGRLLARHTRPNRSAGGYSHVTFKNLPLCGGSTFVLFRGHLGSEPACCRFTVGSEVVNRVCAGEQDGQWDD
nr:hypothetical protein [Pandoravirus massiliensis]